MAITIPETEPLEFYAGETVEREGGSPLNESVEIGREATGLRNL